MILVHQILEILVRVRMNCLLDIALLFRLNQNTKSTGMFDIYRLNNNFNELAFANLNLTI
jgi:hypothetical protein